MKNKILYFVMGAFFAATIGWSLARPVEAVAPTGIETKVRVLSAREIGRMEHDIVAFERAIQQDRDFLASHMTPAGKGGWTSQYSERRKAVQEGLPAKEQQLEELRAQLRTLRG